MLAHPASSHGPPTAVMVRAGAGEAWRLIRHPIHIAGWVLYGLYLWTSLSDPCRYGPPCSFWTGEQFTGIPRYIVWLAGVPTYAAASLLATRSRRSGTAEWLSSLPTGPETRWAISLMAAVGPFVVSSLAAALAWCYVWTHDPGYAPRLPSFSEYAAAPVAVLGGALLAVMVARWFSLAARTRGSHDRHHPSHQQDRNHPVQRTHAAHLVHPIRQGTVLCR
jgi:hypothetical protein